MAKTIGHPKTRLSKHCGCRLTRTRRGRPMLSCTGSKMRRFVSKQQAASLRGSGGICTYLPQPFTGKRSRRRSKRGLRGLFGW